MTKFTTKVDLEANIHILVEDTRQPAVRGLLYRFNYKLGIQSIYKPNLNILDAHSSEIFSCTKQPFLDGVAKLSLPC
jgi:hypothetical protein